MTWTAPDVTRIREPFLGEERLMLDGWLDFHRQTLLLKCAGLTPVQLKTAAVPPSSLTLLGLVRHMADVERWWFRQRAVGEPIESRYWTKEYPDGDFDLIESADAEADFAIFEQECELARAAVAKLPLEHTFTHPRGAEMSLRWIYVHMIEEYGRHNGHADLIRERIDGVTGA